MEVSVKTVSGTAVQAIVALAYDPAPSKSNVALASAAVDAPMTDSNDVTPVNAAFSTKSRVTSESDAVPVCTPEMLSFVAEVVPENASALIPEHVNAPKRELSANVPSALENCMPPAVSLIADDAMLADLRRNLRALLSCVAVWAWEVRSRVY